MLDGTEPDEDMSDEELLSLKSPKSNVARVFVQKYEQLHSHKFDGEILFIEEFDAVAI